MVKDQSTRRSFLEFAAATLATTIGSTTSAIRPATALNSIDSLSLDWQQSPDGQVFDENRIGFSKGLYHHEDGCPESGAYRAWCRAIEKRDLNAIEQFQLSTPWVDPLAGSKLASVRTISAHFVPWFNSRSMLGEIAELYWASLLRDVPFSELSSHRLADQAKKELNKIDPGKFPRMLFASRLPAAGEGGHLSQFLMKSVPFNGSALNQRIKCPTSSNDFLTRFDEWKECQDGNSPKVVTTYFDEPRYIFNPRALAEFVRTDFSFQAFLSTALIIQSWGRRALNPGLSSRYTQNAVGFAYRGWPQIFALVGEASQLALQDCWHWKWRVFRRLRPEELAGRRAVMNGAAFGAGGFADIAHLEGVDRTKEIYGSALLPQAYPEGSPLHPSFPGGHAEIAGACVTILKAFSDPACTVPSPVLPSEDGLDLISYPGELSVEGELNKLAWNMSFGRSFAGIHYRSDNEAGLLLGEEIALRLLKEKGRDIAGGASNLWFRKFDGKWISVSI